MTKQRLGWLAIVGPGLAMASYGVGGGDVTTGALGGAQFGLALVWVPILAGVLKYVLNEGLARWQLATGQTLLEGWALRMGRTLAYVFLLYLIVWSVQVYGMLISVSGVAMHVLLPLDQVHLMLAGSISQGGPLRSTVAWGGLLLALTFLMVWFGSYEFFEKVMAILELMMTIVSIVSCVLLWPSGERWQTFFESSLLPERSIPLVMAIMGGTGATVGVLAYSYWMRERNRLGPEWLGITRIDLVCSYLISAVVGLCMVVLTGGAGMEDIQRHLNLPAETTNYKLSLEQVFTLVRQRLIHDSGLPAYLGQSMGWLFGIGIAATVVSSLLGLLQSGPYLYADFYGLLTGATAERRRELTQQNSRCYRTFLIILTLLPLPLVAWQRPSAIVMIYAVWGSLFMPFLAATLLVMNNRSAWVGELRNRWLSNVLLVLCLVVFAIALLYPGSGG